MKLNVWSFGLASGITLGVGILLLTLWFVITPHEGHTLSKLHSVYLGYSVTWGGAFIGLLWGFVEGLIGGALLAGLYNLFSPGTSQKSQEE